jgi:hypothetical protein
MPKEVEFAVPARPRAIERPTSRVALLNGDDIKRLLKREAGGAIYDDA